MAGDRTRGSHSLITKRLHHTQAFYAGVFPPVSMPDNSSANAPNTSRAGLPNGQPLVPVYTVPDQDDWLIRAYTKCGTYQKRLTQW